MQTCSVYALAEGRMMVKRPPRVPIISTIQGLRLPEALQQMTVRTFIALKNRLFTKVLDYYHHKILGPYYG
jgi:hypothetical protein